MSLSKSRKIICFLLSVIMVISAGLFTGIEMISNTLCSEKYIEKVFSSKSVMSECEENYKTRIGILAKDSLIPERVFFAADENNTGQNENAVNKFFGGHDSTLYSNNRVETYEKLCVEYLEGNNIEYNKSEIHNVAEKAANIYADSFGLKNTEEIKAFIDKVNALSPKMTSFALLLLTVCIIIIFFMFSKKRDAAEVYCSAGTALGFTFIFTGITALIFGIGNNPKVTPQAYAKAISLAVNGDFAILIIIGILICAMSLTGSVRICKRRQKERV